MSAYVSTGKASFAGIAFDIEGDDAGITDFDADTNFVAEDTNYGTKTYLQILGPKSGSRQLQIIISSSNWNSLKGRIRTQGQLQTASGYARTATLLGWSNPRVIPSGGYVRAVVNWYI